MNYGGAARRLCSAGAVVLLAVGLPGAAARGAADGSLAASLSPARPHAGRALTLAIHLAGSAGQAPEPLRRAVLLLPAGLGLEIPSLRSCPAVLLTAHGAKGCPPQSLIADGSALVQGYLGAETVIAPVTLRAFLGPPRNLTPTFEILSEGTYPISTQVLFTGSSMPAPAPFGEELVMSLPPITGAPNEPDVSVLSFSLTVGARGGGGAARLHLPAHCPSGGLPFAAEFTYLGGSGATVDTTAPCPRDASGRARRGRVSE